jgi:hypothetical protein
MQNSTETDALERADTDHPNHRPALDGHDLATAGRFLNDLPLRWQGQRVLVIGHAATRWGLDHLIAGISLEELIEQDFGWQEGWEYQLS